MMNFTFQRPCVSLRRLNLTHMKCTFIAIPIIYDSISFLRRVRALDSPFSIILHVYLFPISIHTLDVRALIEGAAAMRAQGGV